MKKFPKGYKPLKYIESTGTQYIDTGYKPNQDTKVAMDVIVTDTANTGWLFCGRTAANDSAFGIYSYASNAKLYFVYGTKSVTFSNAKLTTRQICVADKNNATAAGETVSITAQTFTSAATLTLLARNTGGTIASHAYARLYSCQIYDNGTLIRDYAPCMDSNGVAGLWDNVYQIFYGNAGTETFVAGAIVPDEPDEPDEPEVEPPLTPESISVPYVDFANAVILWTASVGARAYKVSKNGEQVAVTEYPFYFDNGLQMESTYNYAITAVNEGGESEAITINAETTKFKLITDRTATDVQEVITAIQTGTLPNNWLAGMKGAYNATDLNRVESAVLFVIERLKIAGWYLTVMSKTNWSFADFPSASEMRRYLDNVALLRSALPASMPAMPLDTDKFNFEEANTLEQILELLDATVTNIMLNVYYSNEIYSGEV